MELSTPLPSDTIERLTQYCQDCFDYEEDKTTGFSMELRHEVTKDNDEEKGHNSCCSPHEDMYKMESCSGVYTEDKLDSFGSTKGVSTQDTFLSSQKSTCDSEKEVLPAVCGIVSPLDQIKDVPVTHFLLKIAHRLGKSEEEMMPLIKKLVCDHWIEDMSYLASMTCMDLTAMGLPHQSLRYIKEELAEWKTSQQNKGVDKSMTTVKKPCDTTRDVTIHHDILLDSDPLSSVGVKSSGLMGGPSKCAVGSANGTHHHSLKDFISHVVETRGLPESYKNKTIHSLCDELWFDSIEQLISLTDQEWSCLDVDKEILAYLKLYTSCVNQNSTMAQVIFDAAMSLQRSPSQIQSILEKVQGLSLEDLLSVSSEEWLSRRLPLPLLQQVHHLLSSRENTSAAQTRDQDSHFSRDHLWTPLAPESTVQESKMKSLDIDCDAMSHFESTSNPLCGEITHDLTGKKNATKPDLPPGYPKAVHITPLEKLNSVESTQEPLKPAMSVKKILLQAGKLINKTEEDLAPVIAKVVDQNWIDSLQTLSLMPHSEWLDIGIPKRLADILPTVLSDPKCLQLNLVDYNDWEGKKGGHDFYAEAWRMQAEIPYPILYQVVRSLIHLIEAILCDPYNENRRVIKKRNNLFRKYMQQYRSALSFISTIGFLELNSIYALFVASIPRLTRAHAVLAQLAHMASQHLSK